MEYITANIVYAKERDIVHGCNAQGVMGSGVALAIKQHFPEAYQEYVNQPTLILGSVISVESRGKRIHNAITQEFYGRSGQRYVSYDAIDEVMQYFSRLNIDKLAMPMIGAGLGGGHWPAIREIVDYRLKNVHVTCYTI